MTLKQELDARRTKFGQIAPPARSAAFERGIDKLIDKGITSHAIQAGDIAPDFTLPNASGNHISLYACLERGPVVLNFYRGGWCPYCNLQLRAYQGILPELRSLGATLMAISPEPPDESLSTTEKNELEFEVLSDINGDAGRAYRLLFDLPKELQVIYTEMGNDLSKRNADGEWHLPIPASYIIATDRRITFAYLDADYRNRLEPAEIVAAVRNLVATTV